MTKKGKKKKQQTPAAATSEEESKKLQQQSVQQQQEKAKQTSQALPGPSWASPGSLQTSPGSSQQVVWGPQKQQSQPQQQQQQKLQDQPQKVAWGPQKQQSQPQQQQQQQKLQDQPQTVAWGPQKQQSQPQQQQQQKLQDQPQTVPWGPQKQQSQPQQQQQQKSQNQPQTVPWGPQKQQSQSVPSQQVAQQQQPTWGSQKLSQGQLQQQQVPQPAWGPRQQQQIPQSQLQQPVLQGQLQQQQVPQPAWGPRQQQQIPQSQLQQQIPWGLQQPVSQGQLQQQQVPQTWGPQQQQQIPQSQLQQQVASGSPQRQVPAWGSQQPQQQIPQSQLQQKTAWGPQQSVSQGQLQQQQIPQTWGPQQQQIPQPAWDPRQQQIPQSQSQQQIPWGLQQPVSQGQLQQQQVPQTWGPQQQQQIPQSQLQQQVASGSPQRQVPAWGSQQPQQQVPQTTLGPRQQLSQTPQQKVACGQSQQQAAQQQRASIDIGAAGDRRQVQAVGMQPSTSTKSPNVSKVGLTDPFYSEVTEKGKMTSEQIAYYYDMIPKRVHPEKAGSAGLQTTVLTNLFKIIFDKNFVTNAAHYDVSIQPKGATKKDETKEFKLPKALCRNIFEQCREKHFNKRYPAYDGKKNAYSANNLPITDNILSDTFEHENLNGRVNKYQIIIKKVSDVDLSWIKNLRPGFGNKDQSALQVLDIIMRHAPESTYFNIGRSLFWIDQEPRGCGPLGDGLVARCGGFMSGALGWKPYLNVDVSYKGFTTKQRVLDYITEVLRKTRRSVDFVNIMRETKIQSFLKGLKVNYEIPNCPSSRRTYRIIKLSQNDCNSTFTQDLDNGEKQIITIENYFRVQKRYRIQYPYLPTLHVNTKADGSEILLPIELCTIIPDQPIKRLNEMQTASMIKIAATDALQRKQRIEDALAKIETLENRAMTQEFRFSVSNEMEKVPARVLSAPNLKYGKKTVQVRRGTWNLLPFNEAKDLNDESWTIVNISEDKTIKDDELQQFKNMFQKTASEFGMTIGKPSTPLRSFAANELNDEILTEYFYNNKTLKLIIVIIPSRTDVMYGNVKKITEIEVGVLTQCIKSKTFNNILDRRNISALKNILLKINSKLNGVNHIFDRMPSCLNERYPCMLVGADVTHPSPDSKDTPSIAAVAASRDKSAFRYNVSLRLQQPKEEMILDIENIIRSQLDNYVQETKCLPKRLVYYRDGVSEGQLPQVIFYEVEKIKRAISEFPAAKGKKIEVTCLVVQKRHHVRLFPTTKTDDRNHNVNVGTIVDTTITHPDHIDFYLVSHASIQGTARPTKYRCIYNESNFTEDQLEELTYYLCHIYARCARSVSYPAPTYYAHLAAYRGRALIQGKKSFNLNDLEREQRNLTIKMEKSPMYFV